MALIPKCTGLLAGVDSYLFCAAATKISRLTSEHAGTMYLQLTYMCVASYPGLPTSYPGLPTSYPGLPTPAFLTCTTNTREGLVKVIMCSDVHGCWVDVWRNCTFPVKLQDSKAMHPSSICDQIYGKGS